MTPETFIVVGLPVQPGSGAIASLGRLEHGSHALMDQVDRLERPNHHLEVSDLTRLVPLDQIHAVYDNAVDFSFELEHCVGVSNDFANVAKRLIEEHAEGGTEVPRDQGSASLRCVNDGRMEDRIFGQ